MDPEFQRDFIWPEDKQSKLIESVLMRIPLPVFYSGRGRPRTNGSGGRFATPVHLSSASSMMTCAYLIPGQEELNNKRCLDDLPPKLQNRVEDCNLTLYIMDAKVPESEPA